MSEVCLKGEYFSEAYTYSRLWEALKVIKKNFKYTSIYLYIL